MTAMSSTPTQTPAAASSPRGGRLDNFFTITGRGSSISREVRGGLVTFFTMAYIIALNPLIIGTAADKNGHLINGAPKFLDAAGTQLNDAAMTESKLMVAAATALVAGILTILMGVVGLIVFAVLVFFAPNYLGHPDNYIEANALATPAHIVPEWYFLPFYAILRAFTADVWVVQIVNFLSFGIIDAKFFGVLAMFAAIVWCWPASRMWKLILSPEDMIIRTAIVSPSARPRPSMEAEMMPERPKGRTAWRIIS